MCWCASWTLFHTGLRADLGQVDPITEAPCDTGQPLRLWECSEYPRHSVPVGAAGHGGHSTRDEWFARARDTLVFRDRRCSVVAGSAVSVYMTGAPETATHDGPVDAGSRVEAA